MEKSVPLLSEAIEMSKVPICPNQAARRPKQGNNDKSPSGPKSVKLVLGFTP